MTLENTINEAILGYCKVNGIEKFVPKLTLLITISLIHRKAPLVYSALTYDYRYTGDIALELNMKSNDVSSILTLINQKTTFVSVMRDGKLKSWAKTK